jgi:hypothetical protein
MGEIRRQGWMILRDRDGRYGSQDERHYDMGNIRRQGLTISGDRDERYQEIGMDDVRR